MTSDAGVGKESNPQAQQDSRDRSEAALRAAEDPMLQSLDSFLDDLAEGHRKRMEDVVAWIHEHGDLDREIHSAVGVLRPLLQKWSIEICFLLRMRERLRFTELKRELDGIGSRTLSQRLKDLEAQGIVDREAFAEVPVRVEYSLTTKGLRMADLFLPIIAHLRIARIRERAGLETPDGRSVDA